MIGTRSEVTTPTPDRLQGEALRTALLCGALVAIEGIDTYGISYIAPLIGAEAHIPAQRMGLVFAATVLSALLGALAVAPLADRVGRRRVLLLSGAVSGLGTFLTPFAQDVASLAGLRFLVGLGLGATLPAAVALAIEHAPPARRGLVGTLMNVSVVVGSILVGFGVALIVPTWGWHALMFCGGGLSLAAVALAFGYLRESPQLSTTAPGRNPAANPLGLLRDGLASSTLLLVSQLALSYLVINFAVYWQPTLIMALGHTVRFAGTFGASTQMLAVATGSLAGWLMDRHGSGRVLCLGYALSALLFVAAWPLNLSLLQAALYLSGMSLLSASVAGTLAFMSGLYPATLRATALGWVTGLARLPGAGGGTILGGWVVAAGWSINFILLAMGALVALSGLGLVGVMRQSES